jgi:hypothetical protein
MIENSAILSKVMQSTSKDNQRLAKRIIKMGVCVNMTTGGHGVYSTIRP